MQRYRTVLSALTAPNRRIRLLSVLVFGAAFVLRLYHLDYRSIWMDEDSQAHHAAVGWQPELVYRAARQQQPPLDYAFEKIGLSLFGWTEIGARIHAVVLGSGAAVLFFLLLVDLSIGPAAVFLGTILFLTNPILVRYSQEGRPISCGVFFAVLWIWMLLRFFRMPLRAGTKAVLRQVSPLFFSSVLLLLSVGFQPFVLFAAFLAAALSSSFFLREYSRKSFLSVGVAFAAFATVLPVLLLSVTFGAGYMGSTSLPEKMVGVLTGLWTLDIGEWAGRLAELLRGSGVLFAAMLPFAALEISSKMRKGTLGGHAAFQMLLLVLVAAFYPPFYNALYYGLIADHRLAVRYCATVIPALVLLFAVLFSEAVSFVERGLAGMSRGRVRLARGLCVLAVAAAFAVPTFTALKDQYETSDRTDWRSFYSLLRKDKKTFGAAYLMNLVPPGKWSPVRFYAARFYYHDEKFPPVLLRKIDTLVDDLNIGFLKQGSVVYLTVPYGHASLRKELLRGIRASFFEFAKLSVVRTKIGADPRTSLLSLFNTLASRLPLVKSNYKIIAVQAELLISTGNLKGASRAIRRLEALDDDGRLSKIAISPLKDMLWDAENDVPEDPRGTPPD